MLGEGLLSPQRKLLILCHGAHDTVPCTLPFALGAARLVAPSLVLAMAYLHEPMAMYEVPRLPRTLKRYMLHHTNFVLKIAHTQHL